jgi:hypothetical protein
MRLLFIAALTFATAASATEPPNARAVFVERRGLIESDAQCSLFGPDVRAALRSSASQARGALLRAGWSRTQVLELEQAVVAAARGRACTDPRTATAATSARTAFATWTRANAMEFAGWSRSWIARRVAGADGWRLRQAIDTPVQASFGVRERQGVQELSLIVPLARRQPAPTSARMLQRDSTRAAAPEIALQQRIAYGLQAGIPSPGVATLTVPSTRSIERLEHGASQAVFAFPASAFASLLALDPRETIEIRLQNGRVEQRILVEVGDVAAARAFLAIGAS